MIKNQQLPYTIIVDNKSDEVKNAIIFGAEECKLKHNFGSDDGVKVLSGINGITYAEALLQSEHLPFKSGVVKIYSTTQQLSLPFSYKKTNSNGGSEKIPIYADKVENGCAELFGDFDINKDNGFSLMVLPRTTIVVKVYPN
jgi:hypothetical protein